MNLMLMAFGMQTAGAMPARTRRMNLFLGQH